MSDMYNSVKNMFDFDAWDGRNRKNIVFEQQSWEMVCWKLKKRNY